MRRLSRLTTALTSSSSSSNSNESNNNTRNNNNNNSHDNKKQISLTKNNNKTLNNNHNTSNRSNSSINHNPNSNINDRNINSHTNRSPLHHQPREFKITFVGDAASHKTSLVHAMAAIATGSRSKSRSPSSLPSLRHRHHSNEEQDYAVPPRSKTETYNDPDAPAPVTRNHETTESIHESNDPPSIGSGIESSNNPSKSISTRIEPAADPILITWQRRDDDGWEHDSNNYNHYTINNNSNHNYNHHNHHNNHNNNNASSSISTVYHHHHRHRYLLWDTSSDDRFDTLRPLAYADTDIFVVVYSLAERDTFHRVQRKWIPELGRYMKETYGYDYSVADEDDNDGDEDNNNNHNHRPPILLVGQDLDRVCDMAVDMDEVAEYAGRGHQWGYSGLSSDGSHGEGIDAHGEHKHKYKCNRHQNNSSNNGIIDIDGKIEVSATTRSNVLELFEMIHDMLSHRTVHHPRRRRRVKFPRYILPLTM
eukprot:gb/GECH01012276.1/.p1 GENE.gb/GECH01012276.1/~~gb/GECH01012276.1/.p1  ORF type:complete len:479 (+),score=105.69 gb/GECH01012276.1/:1-1437(+)